MVFVIPCSLPDLSEVQAHPKAVVQCLIAAPGYTKNRVEGAVVTL